MRLKEKGKIILFITFLMPETFITLVIICNTNPTLVNPTTSTFADWIVFVPMMEELSFPFKTLPFFVANSVDVNFDCLHIFVLLSREVTKLKF